MRRRGVLGSALSLLAIAALALPAAALTVQGRVLNGADRKPVEGVHVGFHTVRGDQEDPARMARSDRQGSFRFADVPEDHALTHYLSTEYQGVIYTEGPLATAGGGVVSQDLVVYEVGRDIASVQVKNQHIVVERKDDGLHITEILVFENTGTTAYLGTGLNHAENAGVRIGLPASVEDFEPGMGGDPQTMRVQGRDLTGSRPIPPGTRPVSFTYRVPLSARMDLSHRLYFPTQDFMVMLDDPKLSIQSTSLTSEGLREQGGKQFAIYRGQNFRVGQEVSMRIQGASFWSNPGVYPWIAAPFAIAGVLLYAARRGRRARAAVAPSGPAAAAPSDPAAVASSALPGRGIGRAAADSAPAATRAATHPAPAPRRFDDGSDEMRDVYLYLISAIDRGVERGEIPREGAALIRQNLKRRLGVVMGHSGAPHAG